MNSRTYKLSLLPLALLAASTLGGAQIERLTLEQMIARTDDSLLGKITKREVIRIDHPKDGPELFYTHLTVEGRSLVDGQQKSTVVTFAGGFISETEGVWNSEAPSDDDIKIGNRVVVFHSYIENMGGDLAANALHAAHGGLYRTVEGRQGTVVLGRGQGYAISDNVKVSAIDTRITAIDKAQREAHESSK